MMTGRRHVIYYPRRSRVLRYGVGLSHGDANGHPVPLSEATWRTVNGIWINCPRGSLWLLFRRPSR